MVRLFQASIDDIDKLAPLLDQYRVFYNQNSDLHSATTFLHERLSANESVIFAAAKGENLAGFTQLYRTYSSVSLQKSLILNDLFVAPPYRNKGVASALLSQAKKYCSEHGFKGLALETAIDNPAQKLYERHGWEKDSHCFHYFWKA